MSDLVKVAVVDTETTGLSPERHHLWEIAIITAEIDRETREWENLSEWRALLRPDLRTAEPMALSINRFYDRYVPGAAERPELAAPKIAQKLSDRFIFGACPWFDAAFLDRWLRDHDQAPAWKYHHVDVEGYAAGQLHLDPPWDSNLIAEKLGLVLKPEDKHTALGDARWAMSVYLETVRFQKRIDQVIERLHAYDARQGAAATSTSS